jgi:hypothetical protein
MFFLFLFFTTLFYPIEGFCVTEDLEEKSTLKKTRHLVVNVDKPKKRKRVEENQEIIDAQLIDNDYASPDRIALIRGKGSKKTGGGKGGFYWAINYDMKRVGKVFINLTDTSPLGAHSSIQIYLNKSSQGKHIGRHAYQKACMESSYDTIYAHISKKNKASCKAALAAGFTYVNIPQITQLLMKWERPH